MGSRTAVLRYQLTNVLPRHARGAEAWGAELAKGEGLGRIYIVEPTGSFVDDPNLTDKKFPGNPTKSYRSREPLRVVVELLDWQGHSPEEIQAMKDGIAGKEPIDD